jgi:hypothetical protein
VEELLEMITWSQLGIHNKPVSTTTGSQVQIYRQQNFFTPLNKFRCLLSGWVAERRRLLRPLAGTV